MSEQVPSGDPRAELEFQMSADVRALSAESDQISRVFAGLNDLSANDFRALLHVMVADSAGEPLTSGALGQRMQVSGGAVTHLVERLIGSGHIRREAHEKDRRKVMLHYDDHGMAVARAFFAPLGKHTHDALAELPDQDLEAAHRVFSAMISAMKTYQDELNGA
ncbi:MAG: MarR family transcriptional regulator [Gordonia sp.]|uniref:MarR family winged helix-turn-helix transcriptional regulator n=1 Tax=Williamsia sp. 1138 TaxID=1903117 RepID=UPI000A118A0E|nr:MarR family transcriptional regulator [Williamsia sp. 1138]MBA4021182.1 MarR family transcriptional regulator [Gordonia sp. (in: high G+C Gram-positive bacteria)]OZG27404.1 MarR family transcriptional regulator [Williamsia sp. 1138]